MTAPDTLKDTCPHHVQCMSQEECDTKLEPGTVAELGERLLRVQCGNDVPGNIVTALREHRRTSGRELVSVLDDGPLRGWKWTVIGPNVLEVGHASTRSLAWAHVWKLLGLDTAGGGLAEMLLSLEDIVAAYDRQGDAAIADISEQVHGKRMERARAAIRLVRGKS